MLRNKEITDYIGLSAAVLGLLALTSCTGAAANEGQRIIKIDQPPSAPSTVLRGNGYDISRMGENVFSLKGSFTRQGILYISQRCKVLSVGMWELGGATTHSVDERVVVVEDGNCIEELVDEVSE